MIQEELLLEGQLSPFEQTMNAFEDSKKKFLEQEAGRFHEAYRVSGDKRLLKIYKKLMNERIKCRI